MNAPGHHNPRIIRWPLVTLDRQARYCLRRSRRVTTPYFREKSILQLRILRRLFICPRQSLLLTSPFQLVGGYRPARDRRIRSPTELPITVCQAPCRSRNHLQLEEINYQMAAFGRLSSVCLIRFKPHGLFWLGCSVNRLGPAIIASGSEDTYGIWVAGAVHGWLTQHTSIKRCIEHHWRWLIMQFFICA